MIGALLRGNVKGNQVRPHGSPRRRRATYALARSRNYRCDWHAVQRCYDEGHTYRECAHTSDSEQTRGLTHGGVELYEHAQERFPYGSFSTGRGADPPSRDAYFKRAFCRIILMNAD